MFLQVTKNLRSWILLLALNILTVGVAAVPARVQAQTTVVTRYVTTVQEERRSTRWTLTEWLRIKERMKLMDVWLAMFSAPKEKLVFRPELNLVYAMHAGKSELDSDSSSTSTAGRSMKAQLYLTNLFAWGLGVHLLNVDLGGEYVDRQVELDSEAGLPTSTNATGANAKDPYAQYYSANLRLFGKNIQDSSLVLKYGRYESLPSLTTATAANSTSDEVFSGVMAGAELQVYLWRSLGLEANYLSFQPSDEVALGSVNGTYLDYGAYVDVSLFRLMGGMYQESWEFDEVISGGATRTNGRNREIGTFAGIKAQL